MEVSEWLREHPAVSDPVSVAKKLSFEHQEAPRISIIIPVHNQLEWTLRCLRAVSAAGDSESYEVIVVDDASTDQSMELLGAIPGLRLLRNDQNLGFLRSVNFGASFATGEFLVLLNNDTAPMPGWLSELRNTFENFPDAGIAGARLLYPDGRLQEAGGLIWSDGSGWNYGRLEPPERPEYSYARRTDYCSAAAIMLPRAVWEQAGGFDEAYAPAYYEDTDLAFRLRELGYETVYQPLARVIHFEGISSGTDITAGVKKHQAINRQTFNDRWSATIATHGSPEDDCFFRGRYYRRCALVVDACTPTPDCDSGSIDTLHYLSMLVSLGMHVTFAPAHNLLHWGRYTEELQRRGVECLYSPFVSDLPGFIRDQGRRFDLVLLFREPVATEYIRLVRAHATRAKIIYHTIDLHFLREERLAEMSGDPRLALKARRTRRNEFDDLREADHCIVVSVSERDLIARDAPDASVSHIPLGRSLPGRRATFDQRGDIVFIGGFGHPPNTDAVEYFVASIWPLVAARLPGVRFKIVGSDADDHIQSLASQNVEVTGYVPDLAPILESCRLTVAPIRFGAGMKGKIVTSLSYGVPCVATAMAVEGAGLVGGEHYLEANDPEEFAAAVLRLYKSSELWQHISDEGMEFCRRHFSFASVEEKFTRILADEGLLPPPDAASVCKLVIPNESLISAKQAPSKNR